MVKMEKKLGMTAVIDFPFNYFNPSYCEQQAPTLFSSPLNGDSSTDKEDDFPQPIMLNEKQIKFELNDHYQPVLNFNGQLISSVNEAINCLPHPKPDKKELIENWVMMINFLNDYTCITDPEQFKYEYKKRLYMERRQLNFSSNFTLCTQGINVDEVSAPRLEDQKLIFYIQRQFIPYRITVLFQKDQDTSVLEEVLKPRSS